MTSPYRRNKWPSGPVEPTGSYIRIQNDALRKIRALERAGSDDITKFLNLVEIAELAEMNMSKTRRFRALAVNVSKTKSKRFKNFEYR